MMQKTIPVRDAHKFMETMGFKRYLETCYWVHRSSCVLKWKRVNGCVVFEFAEAGVDMHGYTRIRGHALHKMVVIAHGGFTKEELKGRVIMHKNDDKQDNRLENLEVGTHSKNAHKKSPVEICIDGGDPQTFPTEREAARVTGCLLYTSPSPRDQRGSRMPSSA